MMVFSRFVACMPVLLMMVGLSATPSNAAGWCNPDKAPRINVLPSTDQISYDFSRSEKQLNTFPVDTQNPYGQNVITDVGGLMKGGIQTQQRMTFGTMTNRATGQVCYWYDQVDIDIHINPTIFVAREFPRGSCMHNAIMEHELKHVVVDREIVNKYSLILGQSVQQEIYQRRIYGPIPIAQQQNLAAMMRDRLASIMNNVNAQMNAERKARQQQIDSLNEYERVNHMCKR